MISDFFQRSFIAPCDDDGIYYIRQLDELDGIFDFDGIVWFGQQLEREPAFANVFMGRLRRGARSDARGNRVDIWEGRFFDVPKGIFCGFGELNIESLTIDVSDLAGGCDFPEHYLHRTSSSAFGGHIWPLTRTFCWDTALDAGRVLIPPPPIPSRIAAAAWGRNDTLWSQNLAALGSVSMAAGFERTSESVTGTWRGDDAGCYYLTEVTSSGEIVWYAEHPTAQPQIRGSAPQPASLRADRTDV
jgi:hypothetical protein